MANHLPDELWATEHRKWFEDTDDIAEPVGEYPDIECIKCMTKKENPDCLCSAVQRAVTSQTVRDILNEHMYIPVWGHCTCLPRNTAVLGINAWNEHIATIITNKGK